MIGLLKKIAGRRIQQRLARQFSKSILQKKASPKLSPGMVILLNKKDGNRDLGNYRPVIL